MPDFSRTPREDIIKAIAAMEGLPSFSGWDRGQPTFRTSESRRSFDTAMQNPAYDAEVERAMLRSNSVLRPSASALAGLESPMPTERLRYHPEVSAMNRNDIMRQHFLAQTLRKFGLNIPD